MKKKKVLIAAGGTGGHLLPAQELALLLRERADVVFAGHHLERSPFFRREQFRFVDVISAPIQNKVLFCLALCAGFLKSLWLLLKERPDVVVGFGSYHTVPVLLASVVFRKKIVLFEANRRIGKVTRLFAPFSKSLAAQFPLLDRVKFVLVPMFPWIKKKKMDRAEARKAYGLDADVFTVLVFGGSQGAAYLNQVVPEAIRLLDRKVQVIHFGMETNPYDVKAVVKKFETDMAKAYAAADFVIGRSGAGTVSELIHFGVPSLLIPYPYAYGHQQDNADYLVQMGAALMLLQKEASPAKIATCISETNLELMRERLRLLDAVDRVALQELIL